MGACESKSKRPINYTNLFNHLWPSRRLDYEITFGSRIVTVKLEFYLRPQWRLTGREREEFKQYVQRRVVQLAFDKTGRKKGTKVTIRADGKVDIKLVADQDELDQIDTWADPYRGTMLGRLNLGRPQR